MKKLTKPHVPQVRAVPSDAEWLKGIPRVRTRNAVIRLTLGYMPLELRSMNLTSKVWGKAAIQALREEAKRTNGLALLGEDIGKISYEELRPWAKRHKIYMR